jgi:hemolysin III
MRTVKEEKWNTITHAPPFVLAMAGLEFSTTLAGKLLSGSLAITFLLSMLYHSSPEGTIEKRLFRMLDMASIHITIAATGVSFCLLTGNIWWPVCLLPCSCNFLYTIAYFGTAKLDYLMVPLCVSSGIISLLVFFTGSPNTECLSWFLLGIVTYLIGMVFYIYDNNKWYHTVWHLFVAVAASIHIRFLW